MDKKELIALTRELLNEENLNNRAKDLQFLKRQYNYLSTRDEDSFYDKQETDQFLSLFNELAKKEPSLLRSASEEKKNIIAEIKKLAERKDILAANKELDKLSEDFKKAGHSSSKELDDELWNEFREAKNAFYAKKRAYFDELNAANNLKIEKKKELIEKAKEVLTLENIKEANEKLIALRKEWKEVGYAGKADEGLWKQFSVVLDEFQEKRKEHHQEMIKLFNERAEKKEALIKKAKTILANSEFSDEEVESVKKLRGEYKSIGFAGKEKDDDLYNRFNEVIQKYFDEMKFYKD